MQTYSVSRTASDEQVAEFYLELGAANRMATLYSMGAPPLIDFVMERRRNSIFLISGMKVCAVGWIFDVRCNGEKFWVSEAAFAALKQLPFSEVLKFCRQTLDEAFFQQDMSCVTMQVADKNIGANSLAVQVGLRKVGTILKHQKFMGEVCDTVLYSMSRPDWENKMEDQNGRKK